MDVDSKSLRLLKLYPPKWRFCEDSIRASSWASRMCPSYRRWLSEVSISLNDLLPSNCSRRLSNGSKCILPTAKPSPSHKYGVPSRKASIQAGNPG
eukprot:CAMPEP_0114415364 /NCGR_PEP_ID=MMETSP0103-20121206/1872_1 /TAXON_ID=37642 ORGANISM="Paraphysomonas imperforata, Strain PA2" /NCGR_SAMPLE_ID=MMETSP0103 /ASSEMBLY_ACC=CAM_ASM_000201 /LENGTH=95 /DNA_ID=CAMNT_0001583547 /DNA_START=319 /DNA_END=606 /DNA_ORIENTATION=+